MTKTITANIPARKVSWNGKTSTYPARVDTFEQDEQGRWTLIDKDVGRVALTEAEAIDVCIKATNWQEIKAAHFPMYGFHS